MVLEFNWQKIRTPVKNLWSNFFVECNRSVRVSNWSSTYKIPNKIDHYGGVEAGVTLRPLFFKGFLGKPLGEIPHYSRSIIRADWHSNQSNDGYVRILKLATYIYIVDRTLNNRD